MKVFAIVRLKRGYLHSTTIKPSHVDPEAWSISDQVPCNYLSEHSFRKGSFLRIAKLLNIQLHYIEDFNSFL